MSDPLLAHELLHGTWLAFSLLEQATTGDAYGPVYQQCPDLLALRDKALDAVFDLYQAFGRIESPP